MAGPSPLSILANLAANQAAKGHAPSSPPPAATHHDNHPQKESFTARWANRGWAIQSWNDLFSRWFPSLERHSAVDAQGDKACPNRAVVHTALSIAFGMLRNHGLTNVALKMEVNHTENSAHVEFGISTTAVTDIINTGMIEYSELGISSAAIGGIIGRRLAEVIQKWRDAAPGVGKRGQAAEPPAAPDIPAEKPGPGGRNLLDILKDISDRIRGQIGAAAIWDAEQEVILGGFAPSFAQVARPIIPFDNMVDRLQLNRDPGPNPQPPTATGDDLRTLVAQILHDPGVRPPLPRTNAGPPTILNELVGK